MDRGPSRPQPPAGKAPVTAGELVQLRLAVEGFDSVFDGRAEEQDLLPYLVHAWATFYHREDPAPTARARYAFTERLCRARLPALGKQRDLFTCMDALRYRLLADLVQITDTYLRAGKPDRVGEIRLAQLRDELAERRDRFALARAARRARRKARHWVKVPADRCRLTQPRAPVVTLTPRRLTLNGIPMLSAAPLPRGAARRAPGKKTPRTPTPHAMEPAARAMEPAARAMEPAAHAMEPAARTMEPAARAMEPAARAMEPAARAMEPAARAMEPAARAMEPAARAMEPAARARARRPGGDLLAPASLMAFRQQLQDRLAERPAPDPETSQLVLALGAAVRGRDLNRLLGAVSSVGVTRICLKVMRQGDFSVPCCVPLRLWPRIGQRESVVHLAHAAVWQQTRGRRRALPEPAAAWPAAARTLATAPGSPLALRVGPKVSGRRFIRWVTRLGTVRRPPELVLPSSAPALPPKRRRAGPRTLHRPASRPGRPVPRARRASPNPRSR